MARSGSHWRPGTCIALLTVRELDPLVVSGHSEAPTVGGGFAGFYPPLVRGIDLIPGPPV